MSGEEQFEDFQFSNGVFFSVWYVTAAVVEAYALLAPLQAEEQPPPSNPKCLPPHNNFYNRIRPQDL